MKKQRQGCVSIVAPIVGACTLLIGAIVARIFWLSLALGAAGAVVLGYAIALLRSAKKADPDSQKAGQVNKRERPDERFF